MEAFKLRAYSRRRQKKVHCSSPLPGVAASIPRGSSKAGPFQPCRRLFAPPLRESNAQSVKGNPNVKALSKINENFEVTKVNNSADQSVQLNDEKITNTDIRGKSTTQLKESLQSNCESNESWRNSETTSGMTLPTGVSTFLLDCLDMDSSTESIDSMNSCPSPEIFRNEDSLDRNNSNPEECLKYKNSTLLDTSKAVTIDKMPQLSNLSEILEPIYEGHQDQYVGRESPTKCNKDSSKLMNVSTIVAGKQVGKIMSSTEKTPDAKISLFSSVSGRRKRQMPCFRNMFEVRYVNRSLVMLDNQIIPKNMKCRKKVKFSSLLKNETSSCHHLVPAECTLTKSQELMAEMLPSKQLDIEMDMNSKVLITEKHRQLLTSTAYFQPEELEVRYKTLFNLSPVHKTSFGEDLFLNSSGPYVNSEEIAPASLSLEEKTVNQSVHHEERQNKKLNRKNKEICSIVKTSPGLVISMGHRIPVNRNMLNPSEGITEDVVYLVYNGNNRKKCQEQVFGGLHQIRLHLSRKRCGFATMCYKCILQ
ncbi:meiosis-specific kinetochore protein isoform X2 [Pelodiscus sinensis]|uniref:meiosis-specific kinetochore protein isoform X2 n=1 Tax=Pelodiscus sinensis TaxID=13735 RepID=UPI003F6C38F1